MQNSIPPQAQYQQQPFRPTGYRVIPVANEASMGNVPVDYNGNPTYFHNQSTDEICIRYFDIRTGITSDIKYVRANGIAQTNAGYDDQLKAINERLDSMAEAIKQQPEDRWGRK